MVMYTDDEIDVKRQDHEIIDVKIKDIELKFYSKNKSMYTYSF